MLSTDNPYMNLKHDFWLSAEHGIRELCAAKFDHLRWKRKFMPERPMFFRLQGQLRQNRWEARGLFY